MFGRRSDGKKVKGLDGFSRLTPLIMPHRNGSTNIFLIEQEAAYLDNFIAEKKEQGISYNYLIVITTALVRLFRSRPKVNRFIINGRIYQRNHIDVAMVVKKALRDSAKETTIKMRFTGYETVAEVKKIIDAEVRAATHGNTATDDTADGVLSKMPQFLLKFSVGFLRLLDRWGLLPKSILKASPFHASIFITHLKSIKLDFIYHHLYDFGNVGFFISIGKERIIPFFNSETQQVEPAKVLKMGLSIDERYADGLYYSNTLRKLKEYLRDPALLEKPLEESEIYNEPSPSKKQKLRRKKKMAELEAKESETKEETRLEE